MSIDAAAPIIKTAKNTFISMFLVAVNSPISNTVSGIIDKTYLRVVYTATTEGNEKSSAIFIAVFPFLKYCIAPTPDKNLTTNNE